MTSTVVVGVVLLAAAAVMGFVGRLGWTHASALATKQGGTHPDRYRQRVVRRGAAACMVIAALFVVGAITGLAGALP